MHAEHPLPVQGRGALLVVALAAGLAACGPSKAAQNRMAELEQAAAQKDSLVLEMADLGRFISDVNSQLADVTLDSAKYKVVAESPTQATHDSILTKIRYLNDQVSEGQTRLTAARRRIRSLAHGSDSLETLLKQTVDNYQETLTSQRDQIAGLTAQVDTLTQTNTRLAASVDTLSAKVDTLQTQTNTVYYVIGTKKDLLDRGIVQEEGGAHFLFILGKRGETLVPARDLDPSQFTAINKDSVTSIPLPDSTAE